MEFSFFACGFPNENFCPYLVCTSKGSGNGRGKVRLRFHPRITKLVNQTGVRIPLARAVKFVPNYNEETPLKKKGAGIEAHSSLVRDFE